MDNDNRRARLYYLFGASQTPKGSSWLERLPAGLFAIPVGLFGLAAAWRRAADSWPLAADVGNILVWTATAIWALSLLLYAAKCKRYPQAVLREFQHPVQGSLQALLPLSLLLAILHFGRSDQGIWLVLTFLALGLNALIAFRVVSVLATGQMPANAVTPALYLPLVGGALVGAMACAGLGHVSVAALLFGTGLAGWGMLEARILSSLFQGPMPEALRPTIGIELAPPAIATLAAALIWPALAGDVLTIGLGVAAAPVVGVLARYRWWSKVPFSIGFWSFSFPLAALAGAVIEAAERNAWPQWLAAALLLAASAVIALLAIRTVVLLLQGKLLPPA